MLVPCGWSFVGIICLGAAAVLTVTSTSVFRSAVVRTVWFRVTRIVQSGSLTSAPTMATFAGQPCMAARAPAVSTSPGAPTPTALSPCSDEPNSCSPTCPAQPTRSLWRSISPMTPACLGVLGYGRRRSASPDIDASAITSMLLANSRFSCQCRASEGRACTALARCGGGGRRAAADSDPGRCVSLLRAVFAGRNLMSRSWMRTRRGWEQRAGAGCPEWTAGPSVIWRAWVAQVSWSPRGRR